MAPKEKVLNAKEQAFVDEYLLDMNATAAAVRAGYAATTANKKCPLWVGKSRLDCPTNKLHVWDAVNKAKQERSERTKIDADYVLKQATKLHERCMQEIEPYTDRKGEHVHDENGNPLYVFNAQGAAKGLELIGKHVDVQAFRERTELTGPGGGPVEHHYTLEVVDPKEKGNA